MALKGTRLPTDANGRVVNIPFHPGQAQQVSYSKVSTMGSAFANPDPMVRLWATQPCFFKPVDSSGTASATDHYLPQSQWTDILLRGENRIAVIGQSSAVGTLYITERN